MIDDRLLRQCSVFKELSESQLSRVGDVCQSEQYEAGAPVFMEKSPAGTFYVLEEGKVALQIQLPAAQGGSTRRATIDISSDSDVFGWSSLVDSRRYTLTAICLEPTKVIAIDGAGLKALLSEDHDIGYHVLNSLIKVVASRLDETRQLLVSERVLSL